MQENTKSIYSVFVFFQYFAECHAVIYIVDSSDRERISESKETFGKYQS